MAKIKSLKQNPLFKDFSNREVAVFSQIADEITLAAGDPIPNANHGLIIIKKGGVQVDYQALNGSAKKVLTVKLGPGDFFGELALLSGDGKGVSTLKIAAYKATEILQILPQRFYDLTREEPQICFKIVRSVSQNFSQKLF